MRDTGKSRVYLGLGSNLGERARNLLAALRMLDGMEGLAVREVSSVYESEPWGFEDQPRFLNLVAMVESERDPRGVLEACREVERALGRVRGRRWGPRVIDVDVLLYEDMIWEDGDLTIPHPLMLERDFVMVPLLELAPRAYPPGMEEAVRRWRPRQPGHTIKAFRFGEEEWHG